MWLGLPSRYLPSSEEPLARKILLADDSVTAQNMGRKILADAGYEVITVNNGSAALKKIAEHKPDLIVLDVYMPGYSGLEVCQRLKETHETSRVPILLTVGKLEPFKPEEAKRARADAFIVKPFEASELLSALSKLEDKIVPRSETSKPGRFGRTVAALDEGRYDKTVAVEEDSGWKSRIAFPSKKKKAAQQEDGEDPSIYNPMNTDLRTVVERKEAGQAHDAKAEEARVDLGALAPEGLPKDVTPEEIAALAAAAAQVKGKVAESKVDEPFPAQAQDEPKPAATEAMEQGQPAIRSQEAPATFAEQKSQEKIEALPEIAPHTTDVMAALAGLEANASSSLDGSSENRSWIHAATEQAADEPVTMAAAAEAGTIGPASRWTAVSVALAPEETAISLEQEMQKAYAAFAAAEVGRAGVVTAIPETQQGSTAATEASSVTEAVVPEPVIPVPASPAPEEVQTVSAVGNGVTEAVRAAVREFETVAASYVEPQTPAPVDPEPDQMKTVDAPQTVEASAEENAPVAAAEPEPETAKVASVKPDAQETPQEELKNREEKSDEGKNEEPSPAPAIAATVSESESEATVSTESKESDMMATTAAAWASWRRIRESGDPNTTSEEPVEKESEQGDSASQDAAAMAVAAGAEKPPEPASAESESDPEAIASIVDSVLADLRPKIFEEITRKMGKKK